MADGGKVIIKIDGDSKGFKSAMGGIDKLSKVALKGIAIGAGAAATAIGAIGTAAVKSYSEFEQLSSGAQKIFDEIDYAQIKKDADEAFKTMQISANQYLQLMTTVGANFASTLGDAKGYEVAKQGMQAITDFATGTGRSIDELSEKYQMITKSTSSYQSIADQFAGVLPATSAEFLKQAQAAGILGDSYTKLTDVPMAEYQEAVTQMIAKGVDALGLTNNAANEAATTLSGSFNMFKASWDNLMVGLADPSQDLDALIQNVVDSASAVFDNLTPVIDAVLSNIPSMMTSLADKLIENIPTIVEKGIEIGVAFVTAITDQFPLVGDGLTTLAIMFGAFKIGTTIQGIVQGFQTAQVTLSLFTLQANGASLAQAALNGTLTIGETVVGLLTGKIKLAELAQLAMAKAQAVLNAVMAANPIALVVIAIGALVAAFVLLWNKSETFRNFWKGLWESIVEWTKGAVDKCKVFFTETIPNAFNAVIDFIKNNWQSILLFITNPIAGALSLLYNLNPKFKEWVDNLVAKIKSWFGGMVSVGKDLLAGLWNGINNKVEWLKGKVKGVVDKIKSWFTGKDGFDEHSPSKWSEEVFAYVIDGGVNGLERNKNKLLSAVKGVTDDVRTEVEKLEENSNKKLLASELKYFEESARLEKEKYEKEKKKKFDEAKNAEELEKVKQEYILKEQEEAEKKYLENLKETADKEREIYDALQKDIENWKKSASDALTDLADNAFDKIEEIESLQKSFADKLKGFGELYTTSTYELNGRTYEKVTLGNLSKQKEQIQEYAQALLDLKARGDLPKEFFNELRNMSVEEGTKFAKALLRTSDKSFDEYIKNWKDKQKSAETIAAVLYEDEATEAQKGITESFEKYNEDLVAQGEKNAEAWGEGFFKEIKSLIPQVYSYIMQTFSGIAPTTATVLPAPASPLNGSLRFAEQTYSSPKVIKNEIVLNGRVLGENIVTLGNEAARVEGTKFSIK